MLQLGAGKKKQAQRSSLFTLQETEKPPRLPRPQAAQFGFHSPQISADITARSMIRIVHFKGRKGLAWEAIANLAQDSRTDLRMSVSSASFPGSSSKGLGDQYV